MDVELLASISLREHGSIIARKLAYSRSPSDKAAAAAFSVAIASSEMRSTRPIPLLLEQQQQQGAMVGDEDEDEDEYAEDDMLKPSQLALGDGSNTVLDSARETSPRSGALEVVAGLLRLAQQSSTGIMQAEALTLVGVAELCTECVATPGPQSRHVMRACDRVLMHGWSQAGLRFIQDVDDRSQVEPDDAPLATQNSAAAAVASSAGSGQPEA